MKVSTETYRTGGGEITLVTFTNASGASVTLSTLGAAIEAVRVPDRYGNIANVVVRLEAGRGGFWAIKHIGDDEVVFARLGGSREPTATYRWTEDNVLEMYLSAAVDVPDGACFNLDGRNGASALDEYLWLNASCYLPGLADEAVPVAGTPMDFTTARPMGRDVAVRGLWLIDNREAGLMNEAAVLASHATGRQLSVFTTQPVVEVAADTLRNGVAIACREMPEGTGVDAVVQEETTQLVFLEFSTF